MDTDTLTIDEIKALVDFLLKNIDSSTLNAFDSQLVLKSFFTAVMKLQKMKDNYENYSGYAD